jgi:putative membrane protein
MCNLPGRYAPGSTGVCIGFREQKPGERQIVVHAPDQSLEGREMDTSFKEQPVTDRRQELAEERTFLAWIRTGIGMFWPTRPTRRLLRDARTVLRDLGPLCGNPKMRYHKTEAHQAPHEPSLWFGTLIIAVGVAVHLFSAWRYARLAGELRHAHVLRRHLSEQGVVVALILALLGIALAIYMILVHGQPAGGAMRA